MSAQASRPYLAYVILLLFLVNAANYGQRMIISIILPAIKAEIALTDAQLGILMGGGFALFFAVAGVPLARLADRSVRRTFLAGAILFWSSATALFGATQYFRPDAGGARGARRRRVGLHPDLPFAAHRLRRAGQPARWRSASIRRAASSA